MASEKKTKGGARQRNSGKNLKGEGNFFVMWVIKRTTAKKKSSERELESIRPDFGEIATHHEVSDKITPPVSRKKVKVVAGAAEYLQ
jgi:hypothetical protein